MIDADISMSELEEIAKRAYVSVASNRSAKRNGSVNQSSVAAITGLSRPEVKALFLKNPSDPVKAPRSRAGRVIDGWTNDSRFITSAGEARVIPLATGQRSFAELVRLYAGDIPPKAMLDRLERLKLVRILPASRSQPRRVQLARTTAAARLNPQVAVVLGHLSDALRAACSEESVPFSTVRLFANDESQLAAVGRAANERKEAFLSGLESSFPPVPGNERTIEIVLGLWQTKSNSTAPERDEPTKRPRVSSRQKRRP